MTQDDTLEILKTGTNVFLTGEPGSGKTHTVNRYVAWLRSHGIPAAITATTGIAATHIGGTTIHSWSGVGVRTSLTQRDVDGLRRNKRVARRIGGAKVLIIDEISMLSAQTFEMVEAACRIVRNAEKPFGGLQVVLVGDFFQLPPVGNRGQSNNTRDTINSGRGVDQFDFMNQGDVGALSAPQFAYESRAWTALAPAVCYLSEQHRQEDATFLRLLSAIRTASFGAEHAEHLQARLVKVGPAQQGITKLFSHNIDVDRVNELELAKLAVDEREFVMQSTGPAKLVEQLKKSCLSPERLRLKIGAKVMFTKNNFEAGYVNGTTGTVIGFRDSEYDNPDSDYSSDGNQSDDYRNNSENGSGRNNSRKGGVPLVETRSGRVIPAEPAVWKIESEFEPLASVSQVPLRLAWAITVHKSQGMSLDAAVVDLSGAFEYGQGYVALSRVRTLEGLHLVGLNRRALEVHPNILLKDGEFRRRSDAAAEKFMALEPDERAAMQENFIRACGGSIKPISREDTIDRDAAAGNSARNSSRHSFANGVDAVRERETMPSLDDERNYELVEDAALSEPEIDMETGAVKAADLSKSKTPKIRKTYSLEEIRQKYPNAYQPWTAADDADLRNRFEEGEPTKDIAKEMGRKYGAIRSRLVKLGLVQ